MSESVKYSRRQMLASVAVVAAFAVPLAGCDASVTLAAIVAEVQKACGFVTTWEQVAAVVISILATFNAAAGAAATVAADIAKQVTDMICMAVMAKIAQGGDRAAQAGNQITVLVNGVSVTGTLAGKPSVTK